MDAACLAYFFVMASFLWAWLCLAAVPMRLVLFVPSPSNALASKRPDGRQASVQKMAALYFENNPSILRIKEKAFECEGRADPTLPKKNKVVCYILAVF